MYFSWDSSVVFLPVHFFFFFVGVKGKKKKKKSDQIIWKFSSVTFPSDEKLGGCGLDACFCYLIEPVGWRLTPLPPFTTRFRNKFLFFICDFIFPDSGLCVPALALMSRHLFFSRLCAEEHRADQRGFCHVHAVSFALLFFPFFCICMRNVLPSVCSCWESNCVKRKQNRHVCEFFGFCMYVNK